MQQLLLTMQCYTYTFKVANFMEGERSIIVSIFCEKKVAVQKKNIISIVLTCGG